MLKRALALLMTLLVAGTFAAAQEDRVASPAGTSATQLGEKGRWLEITAGRPIKRGRDLWGSGPGYGKTLLAGGATVWRAGANVSTRLKTEAPLEIGGKTVPPGEYSLFIDLKSSSEWTLIVSSWGAKKGGGDPAKDALWGAYNYTPDKDVARVAMKLEKLPVSVDQLTWNFADVTPTGGKIVLMWDTVVATAPFTVR
jgi:hypothetical protein